MNSRRFLRFLVMSAICKAGLVWDSIKHRWNVFCRKLNALFLHFFQTLFRPSARNNQMRRIMAENTIDRPETLESTASQGARKAWGTELRPAIAGAGAAVLAVSVILFLQSCSSGQAQPPLDIGGSWSGSIYPGCRSTGGVNCYARLVTFSFVQQVSNISGSYTCSFGNVGCLGDDNSGKIVSGKIEGADLSDLRIAFSDASNCLYQGQFTASEGTGAYMCFAGAGRIVEQGGWHLKRTGQ